MFLVSDHETDRLDCEVSNYGSSFPGKGKKLRQKPKADGSAERHVKEIKRNTRRKFSAEEKISIVLEGLRN